MKLFGMALLAMGLFIGGAAFATDTVTTAPAKATCCGEKCATMKDCCKAGADGKMTCSMGGACCEKHTTVAPTK